MRNIFLFLIVMWFPISSYAAGKISVTHPWARPTMGSMKVTSIYMELENKGVEADVLVGVFTPIAQNSAIHSTVMRDGIMHMVLLDNVSLPVQEKVIFSPGKLHIMLTGITKTLTPGEKFPLLLTFQKAGRRKVEVAVEK